MSGGVTGFLFVVIKHPMCRWRVPPPTPNRLNMRMSASSVPLKCHNLTLCLAPLEPELLLLGILGLPYLVLSHSLSPLHPLSTGVWPAWVFVPMSHPGLRNCWDSLERTRARASFKVMVICGQDGLSWEAGAGGSTLSPRISPWKSPRLAWDP